MDCSSRFLPLIESLRIPGHVAIRALIVRYLPFNHAVSSIVDEMVIFGRSLHTQPPIPRYFCTVVGSQNTHNHDLGRTWP